MKKVISLVLVFTMIVSSVNIAFAQDTPIGNVTEYTSDLIIDDLDIDVKEHQFNDITVAELEEVGSCIEYEGVLGDGAADELTSARVSRSASGFSFNSSLLTHFNTIARRCQFEHRF